MSLICLSFSLALKSFCFSSLYLKSVSHTPLLMNNIFSLLSVSFKCCSISTVIEVKGNIITDFHVKGAAVQESIYLRRQLKAEDMCMSMLSAFLVRENQSGLDILGGKSLPIDFDLFPLHLIPKSWWNGNSICSWDSSERNPRPYSTLLNHRKGFWWLQQLCFMFFYSYPEAS